MFTADGRRLTSVEYEVRNNRRQYLRLDLPEGAELWSTVVAGRAVQPARAGDGRIMVPLIRSQSAGGSLASFGVEVVYVETGTPPDASGRTTFEAQLPGVDVPTTYVGWTVYVPWEARVKMSSVAGSLAPVDWLSTPLGGMDVLMVSSAEQSQVRSAGNQASSGSLGDGAAPVRVQLPLDGYELSFEKLLALDERLWVSFDIRGLK
jgi:putative transposon-encoded protein